MSDIDQFRARKDAFFRDDPDSPIAPERRPAFAGLAYYEEEDALRLRTALDTEGVDRDEPILMQTTSGDVQEYRRAGVVRFQVDGEGAELNLYRSEDAEDLFLPFRDATSGTETYGAGRYLEVEPPGPDGRVEVDFNYAYNPYCAYDPNWACPLPPTENWVEVPIRAGERSYPGGPTVPSGD